MQGESYNIVRAGVSTQVRVRQGQDPGTSQQMPVRKSSWWNAGLGACHCVADSWMSCHVSLIRNLFPRIGKMHKGKRICHRWRRYSMGRIEFTDNSLRCSQIIQIKRERIVLLKVAVHIKQIQFHTNNQWQMWLVSKWQCMINYYWDWYQSARYIINAKSAILLLYHSYVQEKYIKNNINCALGVWLWILMQWVKGGKEVGGQLSLVLFAVGNRKTVGAWLFCLFV